MEMNETMHLSGLALIYYNYKHCTVAKLRVIDSLEVLDLAVPC